MLRLPQTSHAARFQQYFSILQDTGVDLERALSLHHIAPKALYEPDLVVPCRLLYECISSIARKEGVEDIYFKAETLSTYSKIEPWVKKQLSNTSTLHELLQRYCEIANEYNTFHNYALIVDDRFARLTCTLLPSTKLKPWHRGSDWSNIGLFIQVIKHVLGDAFSPIAVTFQTTGKLTCEMRKFLGNSSSQVVQGCTSSSVLLPKHLLAKTLPKTKRIACDQLVPAPKSFPAMMKALLKPYLFESCPDINIAAEISDSSVRTLQRRLSEFGLTYSKLLEQTRMEVARALLTHEAYKIIDVGYELGYSDPSHFTRAFRRVHGVTPNEYKNGYRQTLC